MRKTVTVTAAGVLMAAAWFASAQQPAGETRQPTTKTTTTERRTGADFRSCHWLMDRDVNNFEGDQIADVEDVLVDRGSGRIDFLILKTGTVLGLGGKDIAVPFNEFRWDPVKERFTLASTTEQLKQYPEWSDKDWSGYVTQGNRARDEKDRRKDAKDAKDAAQASDLPSFSDYYYARQGAARRPDYYPSLDYSRASKLEGEIRSVSRVHVPDHGEQLVATIATKDGATQKIALGPSWFVNGADIAPKRGDKVTIETIQAPAIAGEKEPMLVATNIRLDNRDLSLRGKEGPAWSSQYYSSEGQSYAEPYYRHVRLSKLRGAKLDCRGAECGEIEDVLVDLTGGRVAFLSIDPGEKFLGIGDTKRLVPWSVATVALNNKVRIDANKDMVLASPETPKDLHAFSTSGQVDTVYRVYDVTPPQDDDFWRSDRRDTTPPVRREDRK